LHTVRIAVRNPRLGSSKRSCRKAARKMEIQAKRSEDKDIGKSSVNINAAITQKKLTK
jgi:hypothetical protein